MPSAMPSETRRESELKHTHKLGKSRAGEGTRVWLEGVRLIEAAFTHKRLFKRTVTHGKMVLEIVNARAWDERPRAERGTVAGSPDRPIIDITGTTVGDTFPGVKNVTVDYTVGRITITPAKEST
jgi:hypothetical protein